MKGEYNFQCFVRSLTGNIFGAFVASNENRFSYCCAELTYFCFTLQTPALLSHLYLHYDPFHFHELVRYSSVVLGLLSFQVHKYTLLGIE